MTTKMTASQRIRAAKEVKAANELPRFRYLDDAIRFVESIGKDIDELAEQVKVQHKLLASSKILTRAASQEFDLTAPKNNKVSLKYKIDPDLTKVEIPDVKKLKSNYNLLEQLYEKHRALEMAEAQITAQFEKEGRGESFDAAIAGIRQLKSKVGKVMSETFAFLNQVAAAHVPKSFVRYQKGIQQEIQNRIPFEKNDHYLYVSVDDDGNIVFTDYILLVNAVNEDGQIAPHLYISVQWIVGGKVTVQVNHEFETPTQLLREGGESVGSVAEAVRAISHLLELEDFATSLGNVPLSALLTIAPGDIDLKRFEFSNFIEKLKVDESEITFVLRPEAKDLYKEICYQLFEEMKLLVRNSRKTRWRMDTSKKPNSVTFVLKKAAEHGEIDIHDAEFMRQRFGISDNQLRKIVNIMNHQN